MAPADEDVETTHNADEHRYEARIDGQLAGVAVYETGVDEGGDDTIVFTHTEVDDAFEGKGVGSALARFALDDVRRTGECRVVPQCVFIKGWIDKHPDYADLVSVHR